MNSCMVVVYLRLIHLHQCFTFSLFEPKMINDIQVNFKIFKSIFIIENYINLKYSDIK